MCLLCLWDVWIDMFHSRIAPCVQLKGHFVEQMICTSIWVNNMRVSQYAAYMCVREGLMRLQPLLIIPKWVQCIILNTFRCVDRSCAFHFHIGSMLWTVYALWLLQFQSCYPLLSLACQFVMTNGLSIHISRHINAYLWNCMSSIHLNSVYQLDLLSWLSVTLISINHSSVVFCCFLANLTVTDLNSLNSMYFKGFE